MTEKSRKRRKGSVSEEDISTLLQRYTATTVLALLQEVAQFPGVKLNWNALVKKTSTGISNAREYQMLWRHLAYRDALLDKLEDGAQPLDDDSDLEYELEPCPSVSGEASSEAAACVKVLIASGLPSNSSLANNSTVEAPLTINIPNGQLYKASSVSSQPTCSTRGMNITVPVSVQKQVLPAVTPSEKLEGNGSAGANLPPRRRRKPWSKAEDLELIAAVEKYGAGNWSNILRFGDFKGDRTASQLAQRWTIIKKKFGNSNVEVKAAPQLSEAQLATRSALSRALDMPDKTLTAACTNNPGVKTTSSNSAIPGTGGEASVQSQSQFEQGPIASVQAQNHSQKGPITSVSALNRLQKGSTSVVLALSQPQKGPTTSVSAYNQPQKDPTASLSAPNQPQKDPITSIPTQNNLSQQGPVASVQDPNHSQNAMTTKTSPRGSSAATLKARVAVKKPPVKSFLTTDSILDATAVAAGARIGCPEAAASLLKAVQSKNAIHITTSGGSSAKTLVASGTSSHSEVHSNVQYVCAGVAAEPHSSAVVTSSNLNPGSVKSAMQRVEHTQSASSSSLNASIQPCNAATSIQQCNAVTSNITGEAPPKEELGAAAEIKASVSDSSHKEPMLENESCVSNNEASEGVKEYNAAVSNPESESKNIEAVAVSNPESESKNIEAVDVRPNEELMVEGDQGDAPTNLVEESQNANAGKIDGSLAKTSDSQNSQPVAAEESCGNQNRTSDSQHSQPVAAEGSCGNQNSTKAPAEAPLNDGCTKNGEVSSTAETGQPTQ